MITTLADLKTRFDLSGTAHDTMLIDLISAADAAAKNYMDRQTIESTSLTEYYDGDGTPILMLNEYPIISVTTLHDDLDRLYTADTLISSADYVAYNDNGIIKLDGIFFSTGWQNIKIVYTAGYANVPEDIIKAVQNIAMADYVEGLAQINAIEGADFVYRPDKLRKEAYKMLDKYKRVA